MLKKGPSSYTEGLKSHRGLGKGFSKFVPLYYCSPEEKPVAGCLALHVYECTHRKEEIHKRREQQLLFEGLQVLCTFDLERPVMIISFPTVKV